MTEPRDSSKNPLKRKKHEQARDRALVAEYRLKGLNNPQIAAELNNRIGITYTISTETVRADYERCIKLWNEKAMTPTGADMEMQKQRLNMVEAEAWAAWERSKDNSEQTREVQKLKDILDKEGLVKDSVLVVESLEKLTKGQVGNEQYLKIVLDCWDKRARLDGQYMTKILLRAEINETKTVTHKMFVGANPLQWDDPTIEVIGGKIHKDGKLVEIIDGEPIYMEDGDD